MKTLSGIVSSERPKPRYGSRLARYLWLGMCVAGFVAANCSRTQERKPNQATPLNPPAPPSYRATVTEYTKGRYKTFTYDYTPNEIVVTRHSVNARPDKVLFRRKTTPDEDAFLSRYCTAFPFASLKDSYTDDKTEGETHQEFYVEWSDSHRTIYVYYATPPELRQLEEAIEKMLPANRDDWYNPY